jgi:hypothetical protein
MLSESAFLIFQSFFLPQIFDMKKLSCISMVGLALLISTNIFSQADSSKTDTQFKIGVFYNSHLNYYGRTDSLRSSGVFPLAELWFTPNFYVNAAPVFVNNALQNFKYSGTVTTAGYRFNDQKKWAGNFYFVKPFYTENSELVQSALKAQVAGTLTWQSKIINITGGGDVKFSNNTDYGATAGVDHLFRMQLTDKMVLVANPSAYLNAGTQQFTNTYYKKNNFLIFPGTEQQVSETVKQFSILSYEFSMPLILARDKFQVLLIPAYVMPQNLTGPAKNLFYITAGAKIIL